MFSATLKRRLLVAHRWLALGLAPIFLLILLSGAVLAVKPILYPGEAAGESFAPASGGDVVAALDAIDPAGKAGTVNLSTDGRSMILKSDDPAMAGTFEVATRKAAADQGLDLFVFAIKLHKQLLIGAGLLVEIATYAMVAILMIGFVFGLPRLRNTVKGWHSGLGWLALPLVVLAPVTGLLMTLHVGMPPAPPLDPGVPIPLARAIEAVTAQGDDRILMARRFKAGGVLVKTASSSGERFHLVQSDGQVVLSGGSGWVQELHAGTWAGAWSGAFNLLSALVLMGVTGTGLYGWLRRQPLVRRS